MVCFCKSVAKGTINGMHLHFSKNSFTLPEISSSFNTCWEDFTSINLHLKIVISNHQFEPNIDSKHHFLTIHLYNFFDRSHIACRSNLVSKTFFLILTKFRTIV